MIFRLAMHGSKFRITFDADELNPVESKGADL